MEAEFRCLSDLALYHAIKPTEKALSKYIYDSTSGIKLSLAPRGVLLYVPLPDDDRAARRLTFPFTDTELEEAIQYLEGKLKTAWKGEDN